MLDSLSNLNKRLNYQGGNQQGRFQKDKLNGLKKALLYSYQAETISFQYEDKEYQFRALINPDKNKGDYDNKILSIPYEDIQLNADRIGTTTQGTVSTILKPGMTFKWVTTHGEESHWLIWLQYLQEDSYFRAEIRKCQQKVEVNGKQYWVYIRGPVETSITWNQKAATEWNDLNHSLVMYITKNKDTLDYFHRFQKIKISRDDIIDKPKTWQVVAQNPYYGDGIIVVYLDEDFENPYEQMKDRQQQQQVEIIKQQQRDAIENNKPYILGPQKIKCCSAENFEAINVNDGGQWYYRKGDKQAPLNCSNKKLTLHINQSKGGKIVLIYKIDDTSLELPIVIQAV